MTFGIWIAVGSTLFMVAPADLPKVGNANTGIGQDASTRPTDVNIPDENDYLKAVTLVLRSLHQPKSNAARRAQMVADIRAAFKQRGSTFDVGELDRALSVIGEIKREQFVPNDDVSQKLTYLPTSLPIGNGQTISDAYIVAIMSAVIRPRPGETALDVGTGSGYQAAVLSKLLTTVVSIEIVSPLAQAASRRLRRLGYRNVEVLSGDGFAGVPSKAPFDVIIVAAGAPVVPPPLLAQLRRGGRMVMPIGRSKSDERLVLFRKSSEGVISRCSLGPVMFVPFTGPIMKTASAAAPESGDIPLCYDAAIT